MRYAGKQANIETLKKKLIEKRPIPDFSHCWGLQPLSEAHLDFVNKEKQKGKKKKAVRKQKKTRGSYYRSRRT